MEGSERFIYDSSPREKFSRSRSNDVCRLITDQPPAERTGGGETAINSPTISVIGKLLASLPAHPRWFTTCAQHLEPPPARRIRNSPAIVLPSLSRRIETSPQEISLACLPPPLALDPCTPRGLCVCDVRTNERIQPERISFPSARSARAERSGPPPSFATSKLWKSLVGSGLDWRDLRRNLIRGDDKRRKYRPNFPIPIWSGKKFSALFEGFLELAAVRLRRLALAFLINNNVIPLIVIYAPARGAGVRASEVIRTMILAVDVTMIIIVVGKWNHRSYVSLSYFLVCSFISFFVDCRLITCEMSRSWNNRCRYRFCKNTVNIPMNILKIRIIIVIARKCILPRTNRDSANNSEIWKDPRRTDGPNINKSK